MSPIVNPNATAGAVPAEGNPQQNQIQEAVTKFMGRPVSLDQVPPEILKVVSSLVSRFGVDGAISQFVKMVPPDVLQQLKGQPQTPDSSVGGVRG